MSSKKQNEGDSFDYLYNRFIKGNPEEERLFEEEYTKSKLGLQLGYLRDEAQMSQRDLAERVGTTETMIDDIENGDYDDCPISIIQKIAMVFGMSITLTPEMAEA